MKRISDPVVISGSPVLLHSATTSAGTSDQYWPISSTRAAAPASWKDRTRARRDAASAPHPEPVASSSSPPRSS